MGCLIGVPSSRPVRLARLPATTLRTIVSILMMSSRRHSISRSESVRM